MKILLSLLLAISFSVSAEVITNDGLPPHVISRKTDEVRNPATVRAFKRLHPCPSNGKSYGVCPGWVVDHILPLKCDGRDAVDNMQWQTKEDSLLKDRWEIVGDAIHPPCSGLSQ